MTIDEIELYLDQIAFYAENGDHAEAHAAEDRLRYRFLRHVAVIGPRDREITLKASLVLRSSSMNFARYIG